MKRLQISWWEHALLYFWFRRQGVKFVIFDFDDTLNDLFPVFREAVESCDRFIAKRLPADQHGSAKKRLREINDGYFLTLSVNPKRWEFIFRDLLEEFGLFTEDSYRQLLQIVGAVYRTAPPLKGGAWEVLSTLSRVRPLGLVTHANREWHQLKMDRLGIARFFDRQEVIGEDGHKDAAAWLEVLVAWHLKVDQIMVVEDNLRSLRDLASLGANHLVWLDEGSGWSMYREGEIPAGLLVIRSLRELLRPWHIMSRQGGRS